MTVYFGWLWVVSGWLWMVLGGFGWFWMVLGGLGWFWVVCTFSSNDVGEAIKKFEEGELLHSVATCSVCLETRPIFHCTLPVSLQSSGTKPVSNFPWKIKKGVCDRCKKENTQRSKKIVKTAAKFSGCFSAESELGPPENIVRHNNMHFHDIPPFLQNLKTLEMALIAKITVVMNVHVLKFGMLSAKGHCVSLPTEPKMAKILPLLPHEVGIIVLRRKGHNNTLHQYTVKRDTVQNALYGLCFGLPYGGLENQEKGYIKYDGPDHLNVSLHGRFFIHCPNRFYCDVNIDVSRLENLPDDRMECMSLRQMMIYLHKKTRDKHQKRIKDQHLIKVLYQQKQM